MAVGNFASNVRNGKNIFGGKRNTLEHYPDDVETAASKKKAEERVRQRRKGKQKGTGKVLLFGFQGDRSASRYRASSLESHDLSSSSERRNFDHKESHPVYLRQQGPSEGPAQSSSSSSSPSGRTSSRGPSVGANLKGIPRAPQQGSLQGPQDARAQILIDSLMQGANAYRVGAPPFRLYDSLARMQVQQFAQAHIMSRPRASPAPPPGKLKIPVFPIPQSQQSMNERLQAVTQVTQAKLGGWGPQRGAQREDSVEHRSMSSAPSAFGAQVAEQSCSSQDSSVPCPMPPVKNILDQNVGMPIASGNPKASMPAGSPPVGLPSFSTMPDLKTVNVQGPRSSSSYISTALQGQRRYNPFLNNMTFKIVEMSMAKHN